MIRSILTASVVLLAVSSYAQITESIVPLNTETEIALTKRQERELKCTKWHFRMSPFLWLPGTRGSIDGPEDVSVQPLPEDRPPFDFDLSPDETRRSLKFAMVLTGEYRSNRLSAGFTYTSLVLDGEAEIGGDSIFQDNRFDLAYHAGDLVVGYRAARGRKFNFDVYAGTRFLFLKAGVRTSLLGKEELTTEDRGFFVDPMVALRMKFIPHYRIEFAAYADIAPIPSETDLSYQGTFVVNILLHKNIFIAPGYRVVGYRFADEQLNDLDLYGWYLRFGLQF